MSCPLKRILPRVGGNFPVMRLKRVVLPAPFWPMIEVSCPASNVALKSETAGSLPKFL